MSPNELKNQIDNAEYNLNSVVNAINSLVVNKDNIDPICYINELTSLTTIQDDLLIELSYLYNLDSD